MYKSMHNCTPKGGVCNALSQSPSPTCPTTRTSENYRERHNDTDYFCTRFRRRGKVIYELLFTELYLTR